MFWLLTGLLVGCQTGSASRVEISNVRPTYGLLGPAREDARYLPGDVVFLSLDIGGLRPDKAGLFRFRVTMVAMDGADQTLFSNAQELPAVGTVMGGRVRHSVQLATDREQKPGNYRIKITVTDLQGTGKAETTFTQEFQLLTPVLGLVRFNASLDKFGQVPVPPVGVVGQMLSLHTTALGFKPDRKTGLGAIAVEFQLLDASDRPVNAKPLSSEFKELSADTLFVPLRFDLLLQRPGMFKLVFRLTDTVEKKTSTLTVPLQVVESLGK